MFLCSAISTFLSNILKTIREIFQVIMSSLKHKYFRTKSIFLYVSFILFTFEEYIVKSASKIFAII